MNIVRYKTLVYGNRYDIWGSHHLMERVIDHILCINTAETNNFCKEEFHATKSGLFATMWNERGPVKIEMSHR